MLVLSSQSVHEVEVKPADFLSCLSASTLEVPSKHRDWSLDFAFWVDLPFRMWTDEELDPVTHQACVRLTSAD